MDARLSRGASEGRRDTGLAVRLENIVKSYKIYDRRFHLLKEALTGRPYHRDKHVLTDISLDIGCGEIVGIIGRNGAGKSTLLKIVAGTLAPSRGTVTVNGRVSAILELGTGFNPNYSGRDNVILSALMRGMSEEEIRRKFDSVVSFAGLEDVIDEPFHTYSSGMQARLAFAAAISVEADVLIIDEALAAGDIRFATRSLRRVREICASGVTALFVSHTPYHVLQLCTRAVWIDAGRIRMDGAPIEVVRAYEYEMHELVASDQGRVAPEPGTGQPAGNASRQPAFASDGRRAAKSGVQPDRMAAGLTAPGANSSIGDQPADAASVRSNGGETHGLDRGGAAAGRAVNVANGEGQAARSVQHSQLPVRDLQPAGAGARGDGFTTAQYRILDIAFLDRDGRDTRAFRFGDPMKLRVSYECLLPELPLYSCGLAVAFNRISDFEAVMYFNTNYPHDDDELDRYFDAPFRTYIGRRGVIEAVIDPIQLKVGEYFVSIGILPNQPGMHEFYQYLHSHYQVTILRNGFEEPSVFYPIVSWSHGPLD